MQFHFHGLILLVAAHLRIKRNREVLAGNYVKTLDGGTAVVGLQEDQPHQLVGLRSEGKKSKRDLKMFARARKLLLRIRKRNGKAADPVPCFAFLLFLHARSLYTQGAALLRSVES